MTARRKLREPVFTVPQVAAILDLPVKTVNNVIDRELADQAVVRTTDGSRSVTEGGLFAVELLWAWSRRLVPEFRLMVVRKVLAAGPGCMKVDEDGVVVELSKHRQKTKAGIARLRQAEALVVSESSVLGGTPCIQETRIPVHVVAALAGRHGVGNAQKTYPSLTNTQIELAVMYARAHPRRGRPTTALPKAKAGSQKSRLKKVQIGALEGK